LPALNRLPVCGPKVCRQRHGARIQQVTVFQCFVVLVIVGSQAQRPRLNPHIDVFGHQHHLPCTGFGVTRQCCILLAQRLHHAQNLVVCFPLGEAGWQGIVQCLGLKKQLALGFPVARGVELQASADVGTGCTCQRVQRPAGLAGVARDLGHAFLVAIKFFQNNHGKKNVMFLKPEQAHGVMQQHIGVQHKQFGRACRLVFSGPDGDLNRLCADKFAGCCRNGDEGRNPVAPIRQLTSLRFGLDPFFGLRADWFFGWFG
jgi:hypothetical protein